MKSKRKQRGWWQLAAAAAGAYLSKEGQQETNTENKDVIAYQNDFNSAQAVAARNFQRDMRMTAYQDTMTDLKRAGLNPMLAYQQGGSGTPSGGPASASTTIPMQNVTKEGVNGAIAAAQIANIESQTKVNEMSAEKIEAEIPQTVANTGQIKQQTQNLVEGLKKITAEIKNIEMGTLKEEEQITLIRAQQQLTNIQKDLANSNITFVQAQTRTQNVLTTLRKYETAGAKNESDFEKSMETGEGSGIGILNRIIQTTRGVLGK